jgi:hypothetical protein
MFRNPVFGTESSYYVNLFGSQSFSDSSSITAALSAGNPSVTTGSIRYDDGTPEGLSFIEAGDVSIPTHLAAGSSLHFGDAYPFLGVIGTWTSGNVEWTSFAGRARYFLAPPARPQPDDPDLIGGTVQWRSSQSEIGGGVTAIRDAVYVDGAVNDLDVVASANASRELTPWIVLIGEGFLSAEGGSGARLGLVRRSVRSSIGAVAYTFTEEMPYLYPLYRPGESGIQVSGSMRLSELSFVSATVDAYDSEPGRTQSTRSSLQAMKSFGSGLPSLYAMVTRNDITRDTLEGTNEIIIADRYSLGIRRPGMGRWYDIRADYIANASTAVPDRGELFASLRQVIGTRSRVDGTLLVQVQEEQVGVVGETRLERQWRGPWSYSIGFGVAGVDRDGVRTGDGAIRLGITRALYNTGWYGRFETRVPVSIGLPNTRLRTSLVALEVGRRANWSDFENFVSDLFPALNAEDFGTLEGIVTLDGQPFEGAIILVDGRMAAVTNRSGKYKVNRVRVGPALVTLDTRDLPPGVSTSGELAQTIMVTSRQTVTADFALGRFVTFQGVVVVCEGDAVRPMQGAKVALIGPGFARNYETDLLGSIRDDAIPPGRYQLIIDATSVPGIRAEEIPRLDLDLTADILGQVIRLRCGGPVLTLPPLPTPPAATPQPAASRELTGFVTRCVGNERQPLWGVEVSILGPDFAATAITDESGRFSLEEIPAGMYLVLVDPKLVAPDLDRSAVPRLLVDLTVKSQYDLAVALDCRQR